MGLRKFWRVERGGAVIASDGAKDTTVKAKAKDLTSKAKDLTNSMAKAKDLAAKDFKT